MRLVSFLIRFLSDLSQPPPSSGRGIPFGTYGPPFFKRRLNISLDAIRTHIHCIGVSGVGKSRFLASLFLTLLNNGLSATLIDPHGDLARLVLTYLFKSGAYNDPAAFNKIRYLDLPAAARRRLFLPNNVLDKRFDGYTSSRNVLEAFRRTWPALDDGAAPNFENIVLAGTFVLHHHQIPLPFLHDLLVDKPWRDQLLKTVPDEQVVRFFTERYDRWAKDQPMLIESSLRRIFLLSFSPVLRYSLSQRDNVLQFRDHLDSNVSTIINLALEDTDSRRFWGCLTSVALEQAALSRADLPPGQRFGSHFLLLDEFSEFSSQSEQALSRILSLTRKYGLYSVLAHQTWSQASDRLRGALQNCGIEVVMRLGRNDAEYTAPLLARVNPLLIKHTVENETAIERTHPVFFSLPEQWEAWCQAITDLAPREAFIKQPNGRVAKVRTLSVPDPKFDPEGLAEIEEHYLRTYFRPQNEIEQEIANYRRPVLPPTTRMRPI